MQLQLDDLSKVVELVGLEINIGKTESMQLNIEQKIYLMIKNIKIKAVDEFMYLGSYIGSTEKDVNRRIALA